LSAASLVDSDLAVCLRLTTSEWSFIWFPEGGLGQRDEARAAVVYEECLPRVAHAGPAGDGDLRAAGGEATGHGNLGLMTVCTSTSPISEYRTFERLLDLITREQRACVACQPTYVMGVAELSPLALFDVTTISRRIHDSFFSLLSDLYAKTILLVVHYVLVILGPVFPRSFAFGGRCLRSRTFLVLLVTAGKQPAKQTHFGPVHRLREMK
jgi:hypothetical protein